MSLFTPLGPPPNSGDPGTFNSRADALLGQLPTMVDEFNNLAPLLMSKYRAACSGTANVIILTAGYISLPTGTQVRFRAGGVNTGAATINLDGMGAKECRTITGAVLPAGYIRTDADTVATYNGNHWVVDRDMERGSNANGEFVRFADGTLICSATLTGLGPISIANGSDYRSDRIVWTFPAQFAAVPASQVSGFRDNVSPPAPWTSLADGYISGQAFWLLLAQSSSATTYKASCFAMGRWY